MERATNRLHRVLEPIGQLKTSAFTTLWVAADSIFFAAGNIDDWEVANDFEFAASAGAGAVFGK